MADVAAAMDGAHDPEDRQLLAQRLSNVQNKVFSHGLGAPTDLKPALSRLESALADVIQALNESGTDQLHRAVPAVARETAAINDRCEAAAGDVARVKLPPGASKIKHVVFVMQENRSFDHYFGTFPGADGIPMRNGRPSVCLPNPATGACNRPHHDSTDSHHGGPHTLDAARADINGGKMDGFVKEWHKTRKYCLNPEHASGITCQTESAQPDVVGYHDRREIPNYWAYAENFVLQDRMFAPNLGWSQPAHLAIVSAWSAACGVPMIPATCRPSITFNDVDDAWPDAPSYGWTDITYLLHENNVSWRYYVAPGSVNECEGTTDEMVHCTPGVEDFDPIGTPEPWNPLPDFVTVRQNRQVDNVQFHPRFFRAAREGRLPSVAWIMPGWYDSEHPPEPVSRGQAWVTRVVNAIMRSPDWKSTAIFVSWDDWGGFYDHVPPPRVDGWGYGLRVPALAISPYAKNGYVDHGVHSFDSYLRLVEDLFLGGQRLDPYTDGRWDPRPSVREEAEVLGDLLDGFDFQQPPRKPLILDPYPDE
ncbi:MAG: alkaline phosphatase family protein [Nocardioidaceae bacterium]